MSDINHHQELLTMLKSGDRHAASWLYDQYSAALYGIIYRMVKSHPKAESIMEETFIKCIEDVHSMDKKLSLFTCLAQTARSMARKQITQDEEELAPLKNEQHMFGDSEYRTLVEGLDPKFKDVFRFVYMEGRSLSEIAKLLDIPLERVRVHLRCALMQLNTNLGGQTKVV